MPSIAKRGLEMPASPIRKLVPYAEAAKAKGVKVYHLNIGQPDLVTPPEFWKAIETRHEAVLSYSHSAGIVSYRKKLCEFYKKFRMELQPDDIIVTCGGSEAIRFAFSACLDPGDEAIVPEPLYANYIGFATENSINIKPITTKIEESFALPSPEEFAAIITPKTKAILICNPSNPTGKLYTKAELSKLAEIAVKHNLFLIADEVYKEFCYDGEVFTSILEFDELKDYAIVIDSVSKRYSACGARVGCLITKNKEVIETAMKFAQARLSPPSLGQIGSEALLDLPQSYYDDVVKEYVARRDYVVKRLQAMEGVVCPKSSGAFYLMPQLPIDDSDRFCQWLLESFSFEGQTVMLAPGTGFYSTPGLGKKQARLAYVLKITELEKAMDCLEQALKQYPNRTLA